MTANPNYFVGRNRESFKGTYYELKSPEDFDEDERRNLSYNFRSNVSAFQAYYWKREDDKHLFFVPEVENLEEEVPVEFSGMRRTCEKREEVELDPQNYRDRKVIKRICYQYYGYRLGQEDLWKRRYNKFCENRFDYSDQFRVYNGFIFRIEVLKDGRVLLAVNPSNSYTHSNSVQNMDESNRSVQKFFEADEEGKKRWAILHYPDGMRKIKLESYLLDEEIDDLEIDADFLDEPKTVYEYQTGKFDELERHISKDDGVVVGRYTPNGDRLSFPASLIYPFAKTDELPRGTQSLSFMNPSDRREKTLEFVNNYLPDYIGPGEWSINIDTDLPEIDVKELEMPKLKFGDGGIMDYYDNTESSWPYLKKEGLKRHGPLVDPHLEKIFFAYPTSEEETEVKSFYSSLRDVASNYNIYLPEKRNVKFDAVDQGNFNSLNKRFEQEKTSYQYLLAILPRDSDKDYDSLKGLPLRSQAINSAYYDKDSDDVLLNILTGIVGEMGTTWCLGEELGSECIIGIDVSGKDVWSYSFTFGPDGRLLGATDGKTLEGEDIGKEKIRNGLIDAVDVKYAQEKDEEIERITIHRDGELTVEEKKGLDEAMKTLREESDYVSEDLEYAAVDVRKDTPFKIFRGGDSGEAEAPRVGTIHELEDDKALLVTFGDPISHQATPQPLYLSVEASNYDFSIEDIARDLFYLSELDSSSAIGKSKLPVSIKYAESVADSKQEGHEILGINL